MIALTCALIVSSYNRRWLSVPVSELLRAEDPSSERLSRLKARLLGPMEVLVEGAVRRGRPPAEPTSTEKVEVLEALLRVTASLIQHVPLYQRNFQERLISAFCRLAKSHSITVRSFCRMLGLKERTFRSWRSRPPAPVKEEQMPTVAGKKKRSRGGTGRFDIFRLLPGIQIMADTTDIKVLGVPLKLIALQDPGNRKSKIFEGLGVHARERAREVVEVITKTLSKVPGTQLITDQGKPYLAELARESYENLELDHAPQRESTPTDRATLERAFGTLKDTLSPLTELTNRLADHLPLLADIQLARRVGELLVTVFLRTYLIAARDARHPLENTDAHQLTLIAEAQRESARKEEYSRRLLLSQIYDEYAMEGSREKFIKAHRYHALEDIQETERIIRTKACRCRTRACDRYFAGVLRNVAEAGRTRRRRVRNEKLQRARMKTQREEEKNKREFLFTHPELSFTRGLDLLSCQWSVHQGKLIADGAGLGRVRIREAVELLARQNPWTFQDDIHSLWRSWRENHRNFDGQGMKSIEKLVGETVREQRKTDHVPSMNDGMSAIIKGPKEKDVYSDDL